MKIIEIRVRPVCITLSWLYAIVGLFAFIQYCYLDDLQQFTFPIGIIGPLVHFNLNINVPKSMTATEPAIYAIAAVLAYAVSGCISGFVGTYLFNFIAGVMGGIDARFVKTVEDE